MRSKVVFSVICVCEQKKRRIIRNRNYWRKDILPCNDKPAFGSEKKECFCLLERERWESLFLGVALGCLLGWAMRAWNGRWDLGVGDTVFGGSLQSHPERFFCFFDNSREILLVCGK